MSSDAAADPLARLAELGLELPPVAAPATTVSPFWPKVGSSGLVAALVECAAMATVPTATAAAVTASRSVCHDADLPRLTRVCL